MGEKYILRFCDDEVVLSQGSTKPEMYKILCGKAAVFLNYGTPKEYLVGVLSEQRCFGELAILCGKPSSYTVVSLGELQVLRITELNFNDFIKNNTQNAIGIMKNLANTVNTLSLNLNMLGEDLATISNEKDNSQKMKDITLQVRQHAAIESISKTLFSALV